MTISDFKNIFSFDADFILSVGNWDQKSFNCFVGKSQSCFYFFCEIERSGQVGHSEVG